MIEKSKTSFFKRLSIVMVSLVLSLALVNALFGKKGYFELRRMEERNRELNQHLEQLRQDNKEIMNEIKSLKKDPKVIEKIAREELGLVKPGEVKITTNRPAEEMAPNSPRNPK